MLTFTIILLLVVTTYLLTDYRRHLEIEDLLVAHAAREHLIATMAYTAGVKMGAETERNKTSNMSMFSLN